MTFNIKSKDILIFIFILIIFTTFIIVILYNNYYIKLNNVIIEKSNNKSIKSIINRNNNIQNNNKHIKGFIPMSTRCCPDTLYSTKSDNYIFTPIKYNNISHTKQDYTIYKDNPWTYYKNPYLQDDIYKIHRKEGPILPDRINYPSQYDNCEFKQVGIISKINHIECDDKCNSNTDIMPLYAKPSKYNRNNYNYYTTNNGNQNLNLQVPIEFKQKNCMEDNGCNEIYDNDIIHVPVFNNNYKVTMYPRN